MPVAALLRRAGFRPSLAQFVADVLDVAVDDDPAFEGLAADGGIELAPAVDELERRADPVEAFLVRVPASMAGAGRVREAVGSSVRAKTGEVRRGKAVRGASRGGGQSKRGDDGSLAPLESALRAAIRPVAARRAFMALMRLAPGERANAGDALARERGLELVVGHGVDCEHLLTAAPRVSLGRQMTRSRALAEAAGGALVGLAPFDPCRPQGVGFVREALTRGFIGVSTIAALPRQAGIAADGGPREREARLLDLLQRCREHDAPIAVHGVGFPWASGLRGMADRQVAGLWDERLEHRRLHGLRVCLVVHETKSGGHRGAAAALGIEAFGALRLAASHRSVSVALPAALLLRDEARVALSQVLRENVGLANRVMIHGAIDADAVGDARAGDGGALRRALDEPPLRHASAGLLRDNALAWLGLEGFVARCGRSLGDDERRGIEAIDGGRGSVARARRGRAQQGSSSRTRQGRRPSRRARAGDEGALAATVSGPWDCECLVLGAGIAGVTAADRLAFPRSWRDEPRSVIVVEAGTRIGGRIQTLRDGFDGPIELGAELIHRPESDQLLGDFSLWRDVKRFGLPTRPIQKLSASHVYFKRWKSNGPALRAGCGICGDPDVAKALDVLDRIAAWNVSGSAPDSEARDFMQAQLADHPAPIANAEAMAGLLLTGTVAGRLGETSVAGLASDEVKDQEMSTEEYHVGVGYDALVAAMAARLDVRLGFEVTRIAWGPNGPSGGVEITSAGGDRITGRTALCTFSVGVLKYAIATGSIVFDPPLPAEKVAALGRLDNGPISKIVMRFRDRFWPEGMSILGHPGQRRAGRSYFVPFFGVPGAPAVLTGLFNGEEARELDARMEGLAEASSAELAAMPVTARTRVTEYINDHVVADLRDVFGGGSTAFTPVLDRWHVRSWANDPRTRGGTSFIRYQPGAASNDVAAIRAALADHRTTLPLYWAGEATAVGTNPWSVHGAHQSGVDAAINLQAFLELPVG